MADTFVAAHANHRALRELLELYPGVPPLQALDDLLGKTKPAVDRGDAADGIAHGRIVAELAPLAESKGKKVGWAKRLRDHYKGKPRG